MTSATDLDSVQFGERHFRSASLEFVRDCPARADLIELGLRTVEGLWTWCVAGPTEYGDHDDAPHLAVTVTLGRYGAQAREVVDGDLGFAMLNCDAVRAILASSAVYVDCRLITQG